MTKVQHFGIFLLLLCLLGRASAQVDRETTTVSPPEKDGSVYYHKSVPFGSYFLEIIGSRKPHNCKSSEVQLSAALNRLRVFQGDDDLREMQLRDEIYGEYANYVICASDPDFKGSIKVEDVIPLAPPTAVSSFFRTMEAGIKSPRNQGSLFRRRGAASPPQN
jgi:hypothetical protein